MVSQDCQEQACAIQTCLSRSNYNEAKCTKYVEDLYRCCEKMYNDGREKSTACPVKEVVARRMKSMAKDRK